jgi:hypothetical protein
MPVKKKPIVDYPDDPDEIPYDERLEMAWEAYRLEWEAIDTKSG